MTGAAGIDNNKEYSLQVVFTLTQTGTMRGVFLACIRYIDTNWHNGGDIFGLYSLH